MFKKLLEMLANMFAWLRLRQEEARDTRLAEDASEVIKDEVDAVENPPPPPSDPFGTDDWNAGH